MNDKMYQWYTRLGDTGKAIWLTISLVVIVAIVLAQGALVAVAIYIVTEPGIWDKIMTALQTFSQGV